MELILGSGFPREVAHSLGRCPFRTLKTSLESQLSDKKLNRGSSWNTYFWYSRIPPSRRRVLNLTSHQHTLFLLRMQIILLSSSSKTTPTPTRPLLLIAPLPLRAIFVQTTIVIMNFCRYACFGEEKKTNKGNGFRN